MDNEKIKALAFLGLPPTADRQAILAALSQRKSELKDRISGAPSAALKAKFETALSDLANIESVLLSNAASQQSTASRPSSLSQTKLADLPVLSPAARATEVGGEDGRVGTLLLDRFEFKEVIGRGGMGVVYRAYDRARAKDIALKQLHPNLLRQPGARERFLNEARLSCELTHASIVRVFDVPLERDDVFVLMELLEGETLRATMEKRKAEGKPFNLADVKAILKPLCAALNYAHAFTVHRDVKPENVWMGSDGNVKLMDFGIAKVMSSSQLTQTGTAMGTAYYMAPEQLKSAAKVDGRADQYAVAVLVYELLSGQVPAGRVASLHKVAKGIPASFSAAIDKALAPDPEKRFSDMNAFASALKLNEHGARVELPLRKIAIASAVVLGVLVVGRVATSLDFKSLLPQSSEQRQQQYNAAVLLEGEVKDLAEKLRQRAIVAEQQRRELEQRKRSLEQSLRTAREGRAELKSELETVTQELAWAEEGLALRSRAVFDSPRQTEVKGLLTLGSRQLQDKLYVEARASLESAKQGIQTLMEQDQAGELIPSVRFSLNQLVAQMDQIEKEVDRIPAESFSDYKKQLLVAEDGVKNGSLTTAMDYYFRAWLEAEAAYSDHIDLAVSLASDNASRAIDNNNLADAEESLSYARKLRGAQKAHIAKLNNDPVAELVRKAMIETEDDLELVDIPGGTFQMGSNTGDEQPIHSVNIKPFRLMKYEVTFTQWNMCVESGGCNGYRPDNGGFGRGNRPVINVSWNDVQSYIEWLNKKTGKRFRLPSESEWEYAARAGTETRFPFGESASHDYANYGDVPCCNALSIGNDRWEFTSPVGSFPANNFGLHDMIGNVFEWVQDCWYVSYIGGPQDGDALDDAICKQRAFRGGSWLSDPSRLHSSYRGRNTPTFRHISIGFRLAQDL